MFPVKNRYDEVFRIEIEGWCYGLANYPGEMTPAIVHRLLRELALSFESAIQHNVAFSILELGKMFSDSVEGLVSEREIAFSVLSHLPRPTELDEEQRFVLAQVIDEVERTYGGAVDRFEKRWKTAAKRAA